MAGRRKRGTSPAPGREDGGRREDEPRCLARGRTLFSSLIKLRAERQ